MTMPQATGRQHFGNATQGLPDTNGTRKAHFSRIAIGAAKRLGCSPRAAQDWLHTARERVAAFVAEALAQGDHVTVQDQLAPIHHAMGQGRPAYTTDLLLDKAEADADEDVSRTAYLATMGAAERDTEIKRLRKEAALATALADALEAVR